MNLLCTLFLWCATSGTLTGPATVIDGDTLAVDGQHVRLAGVDAEELSEPNGYAAKHHLADLAFGTVTCTWAGFSYNRVVGTCYTGGMSLNAQMIRDGFALDCARYSRGLYRSLEPAGARAKLIQKPYCKTQ